MLRNRLAALMLAIALLPATGCVRVVPVPVAVPRGELSATLDRLALVVPIPTTDGAYVATPWHRARLTIGRLDGAIPEVTHTFISATDGLRVQGRVAPLPPGPGYWLRVELVQDRPDGTEQIVGRGWAGDDEEGIDLAPGANLARLQVRPTQPGALIALAPVAPAPAPDRGRWDEDRSEGWTDPWSRDEDGDGWTTRQERQHFREDEPDDEPEADAAPAPAPEPAADPAPSMGDVVDAGWAFKTRL